MKIHCGTVFNQGCGLCGLSEYKHETSWNLEDVTCLSCLKIFLSLEHPQKYQDQAEKQYKKIIYGNDFEDLLK